jgi:hypothetical protein
VQWSSWEIRHVSMEATVLPPSPGTDNFLTQTHTYMHTHAHTQNFQALKKMRKCLSIPAQRRLVSTDTSVPDDVHTETMICCIYLNIQVTNAQEDFKAINRQRNSDLEHIQILSWRSILTLFFHLYIGIPHAFYSHKPLKPKLYIFSLSHSACYMPHI